jgi:hypothetical protein
MQGFFPKSALLGSGERGKPWVFAGFVSPAAAAGIRAAITARRAENLQDGELTALHEDRK